MVGAFVWGLTPTAGDRDYRPVEGPTAIPKGRGRGAADSGPSGFGSRVGAGRFRAYQNASCLCRYRCGHVTLAGDLSCPAYSERLAK